MSAMMAVVVLVVVIALVFDVINGFHDAANSISTVVATRVLTPRAAVLWAAFFNFVAMFIFAPRVADTVAKIVKIRADDPAYVYVVLCALLGAITWNLLTWWWGLPSSSSHALIGGLAGAGVTHAGWDVLRWEKLWSAIQFIPLAPFIGFVLAVGMTIGVSWLLRNWRPARVDGVFRRGQLFSAALYSLGHGGNDAQKTMGIITVLLYATGYLDSSKGFHVPLWVVLACHAAMAGGTMSGGWRIVRTMGTRITKLTPVGGFCAETSGALSIFMATGLGIPVSTTHTITGAIVGTGSVQKLSAVRWGVAGRIVWAWIFTVPGAAAISAATFLALQALGYDG